MNNKELGQRGEAIAEDYLIANGFAIIERNWIYHPYEIDIVAQKNKVTVFVEVKTRLSDYNGQPEEAVGKTKLQHIKSAAELYMQDKDVGLCRIDVIAIVLQQNSTPIVTHFEDVF